MKRTVVHDYRKLNPIEKFSDEFFMTKQPDNELNELKYHYVDYM